MLSETMARRLAAEVLSVAWRTRGDQHGGWRRLAPRLSEIPQLSRDLSPETMDNFSQTRRVVGGVTRRGVMKKPPKGKTGDGGAKTHGGRCVV